MRVLWWSFLVFAQTSPALVITSGDWATLFGEFASSRTFVEDYFRQQPLLLRQAAPWAPRCFGWAQVRSAIFADPSIGADAARVDFDFEARRGWTNVAIDRDWTGVEAALDEGTVVFNSAGFAFAELAEACLAGLEAFDLPLGVNLYLTRPNKAQSAPPHTDRQDVLVVQTAGRKRWLVHASPPLEPSRDPFALGKDEMLDASNLAVQIDQTLEEGDVLYVPAGSPHQTSTPEGEGDGSCHLTFGLVAGSTWGLSLDTLRRLATDDATTEAEIRANPALHAALHRPLPLGFLAGNPLELDSLPVQPEPARLKAARARLRLHHRTLLDTMRRAYNVRHWRGRPYLARVDPYLDELAKHIDALYAEPLVVEEAPPRTPSRGFGAGKPRRPSSSRARHKRRR